MSDRLTAIRRRELWPLTAGEKTRVLAATARGGVAAGRGNSHTGADKAADRVWAEAERRVVAEDRAAEAEKERKAKEKAAKKAARTWW